MEIRFNNLQKLRFGIVLAALTAFALVGCGGGGGDGPAIQALAQTIQFGAVPTLQLPGTATVSATASSGLPISYSSSTPAVCSVAVSTGVVTAIAAGTCSIAANQPGNTTFAQAAQVTQAILVVNNPNQIISFAAAPTLSLFGTATVSATASSGLAVSYSSTTQLVCSVISNTGLVTNLAAGTCVIAANQAGDTYYHAAPQVTQNLTVSAPPVMTVPGAPTGVTATVGNAVNVVTVSIGATDSGGSSITGYSVTSHPAGITATGVASPLSVTCPSTCAGYSFSVIASNSVGDSAPSVAAEVLTNYNIIETFTEPMTQPNDSIFIGSFTFNSTTGTVSNLQGILSESMTGSSLGYPKDSMTWLPLTYQLSSVSDGAGGLLVTTFKNNSTITFTTQYGGDGWSPQAGVAAGGIYAGVPTPANNPGNAYAMIFVNTTNPLAALTQAQINKLAYADCAPGGMMGAVCMTGTTVAGYGAVGTMSGYPVSQVITKKP